jgi:hypothetical protein
MNAKTFLQSIRNDRLTIRQLQERIEELRFSMIPGAIRYDKVQVQTSPDADQFANAVGEIAEYEAQIREIMSKLVDKYSTAQKALMQIENQRDRSMIAVYYLDADLPPWKTVASMFNLSTRHSIVVANNLLQHIDIS